jgi:hypothetical protein
MAKVKHIVLFKFKEGTTAEQIDTAQSALMDLSEDVPGIEDYVSGANNSSEGLSQGYTHGFVMSFESADARDAYLVHPEHTRVKAQLMPWIEALVVFDFEV